MKGEPILKNNSVVGTPIPPSDPSHGPLSVQIICCTNIALTGEEYVDVVELQVHLSNSDSYVNSGVHIEIRSL